MILLSLLFQCDRHYMKCLSHFVFQFSNNVCKNENHILLPGLIKNNLPSKSYILTEFKFCTVLCDRHYNQSILLIIQVIALNSKLVQIHEMFFTTSMYTNTFQNYLFTFFQTMSINLLFNNNFEV